MVASSARKFSFALRASSMTLQISIPASAAGTIPKALSALKRPPTYGSALITAKPAARVSRSSGEPGSVTKTMCRAASRPASVNFDSKSARCDEVSIVEPDFELTTMTVVDKSPFKA